MERLGCNMKLQEFRVRAGYSQSGLAEATGISYSLIRNIEQGQKRIEGMSGEKLYKLALALGCRMEDFLDTSSLVREIKKNYIGSAWGSLRTEEQEMLLDGANAVDGRTGNNMTGDGECTIDLSVYPFSAPGRVVDGEIEIADIAVIYNSEG